MAINETNLNIINLILIILLCLFITGCIPHSTRTTEVGIRVRKIGIFAKRGIEDKIYSPGATYFFMPFINDCCLYYDFEILFYPQQKG